MEQVGSALREEVMTTRKTHPRHAFRLLVQFGTKPIVFWAKVKWPTKPVDLELTEEHVRKSIKLKGIGNVATCSMALCVHDHKDAFPHEVDTYVDWFYRRVYVVSKLNVQGFPIECYCYEHHSKIGQLNDSKGGQQKLLEILQRNGPMIIRLSPPKYRTQPLGRPKGRDDGSRSKRTLGTGAKLRFAMATQGALPE
jgi:hypothetical protein